MSRAMGDRSSLQVCPSYEMALSSRFDEDGAWTSNKSITFVNTMTIEEHRSDLRLAHKYRLSLTTVPQQSSFLVVALFFLDLDTKADEKPANVPVEVCWEGDRPYLVGTNTESCWVGNSICAERAAMTLLRWMPHAVVQKIVIVTDAPHAVAPGMMCREFMAGQSQIPWNVSIVLGGTTSQKDGEDDYLPDYLESVVRLEELYPHPSLYTRKTVPECLKFGAQWKDACLSSENRLMELARQATQRDARSSLHPIRYGAAVLFRDKSYAATPQVKALEYGCSLDAVSQLAPILQVKRERGIAPLRMVQVDQFGIAHAPFAPARALLSEHGFGDTQVIVHSWNPKSEGIEWHTVRVKDLAPKAPYLGVLHQNGIS